MKIGEYLKQTRESKNLSQREAARLANVNSSNLSQIERGRRTPEPETLQKLARVYLLDTQDLLHRAGHLKVDDFTLEERQKLEDYVANIEKNLDGIKEYMVKVYERGPKYQP